MAPAKLVGQMSDSTSSRRGFITSAAALGANSHVLLSALVDAQTTTSEGFVLGPGGGEHLIHFRDGGNIFIKAGASSGSQNLAMGTQQVKRGTGIPVHRHLKMEEAFLILEGNGFVTLNDVRHPFEKGSTIFIPRLTWHSFENADSEMLVLWIVTPAGLDGFFRDTCSAPGAPPKGLTREQIRSIAQTKYFTEFR
jgi:quercetin dioxygenase-like cupin family protein